MQELSTVRGSGMEQVGCVEKQPPPRIPKAGSSAEHGDPNPCLLGRPQDLRAIQLSPGSHTLHSPGSLSTHISILPVRASWPAYAEGNRGAEMWSPMSRSHEAADSTLNARNSCTAPLPEE